MRLKHNKKRNTALIYEAMHRELVKSIIKNNSNRKQKVVSLIKEFFNANSILTQELELYKTLTETTGLKKSTAEKLLFETKLAYSDLSRKKIFNTQSELIKKINKTFAGEIFNNFVPNYRNIATVYSLFNRDMNVKQRVLLEEKVLEILTSEDAKEESEKTPIDNLVYKSFVSKFNESYGDKLNESQKEFLSKYILSFADDGISFKVYINEEIGRLKEVIRESVSMPEISSDTTMVEKTTEVLGILESFSTREMTEGDIIDILKIQNLSKELTI